MRKLFTCLIAPLIVMALMSFTPTYPMETSGSVKDSTTVNVNFNPAQIIVKDNRTTDGVTSLIRENTETNLQVAGAIERLAGTITESLNLQERRNASLVDRITQQTGLSKDSINSILHRKRVYDITFYTLFGLYLLYVYYTFSINSIYSRMVTMNEFYIKTAYAILCGIILFILYKSIGIIINGPDYPIIQSIINTPPG